MAELNEKKLKGSFSIWALIKGTFFILVLIIITLPLVFFAFSESKPGKNSYIETEVGYVHIFEAQCVLGILLNPDDLNIYGLVGMPIACNTDKVLMTTEQADKLEKQRAKIEFTGDKSVLIEVDGEAD